ncbi:hypothetical protein IL306_008158 [Fusarium sp. DS 682]|nr:hypothetical protein IL306_008158 [Fusarium sp. DS 682]
MSGAEVVPLILQVLKLGKTVAEFKLSFDDTRQVALAREQLADQVNHDLEYAEKLLKRLRDLICKREGMLAWISGSIYRAKNTLKQYEGYAPKQDSKKATVDALVGMLYEERKWDEWSRTMGANHSSLMAAVNVMHQLELSQPPKGEQQKGKANRASSIPPGSSRPTTNELP